MFTLQNLAYSINLGSFLESWVPFCVLGRVAGDDGWAGRKAFGSRGSLGGSEEGWEAGKGAVLKRHGLGLKKLGTGIQPPRNLTEVIIQRVLI